MSSSLPSISISTVERKNPGAVLTAFRRAFRRDDDAVLVMKSINAEHDRAGRDSLGMKARARRLSSWMRTLRERK